MRLTDGGFPPNFVNVSSPLKHNVTYGRLAFFKEATQREKVRTAPPAGTFKIPHSYVSVRLV
jgi:hypothetical protein